MKLTGTQVVWILATTEIVAMISIKITPTIQIAKQDAWLSMLVGGLIGLILAFLFVHLSTLHPNQTLIQFSKTLLGEGIGRLVVLPILVAWFILPAVLLRSFADFVHLILLDRTPVWIIMLLLTVLMTYLTYSTGITGIGRFCELVGPLIILTLIISFILNIQDIEWHHLLPLYSDSGWANILKGSLGPAFWFPGPFVLLAIISFVQNPQKALSKSLLGVSITIFMVLTATLMVLLILGPNLSAKIRFSYFVFVRNTDILDFIQNIDVFIMFIMVFGVVAQLSLYFFIACYEIANWFQMKDWRRNIFYGAPAIFIIAILIPDESTILTFDQYWTNIVFPVCGVIIPLFLWITTLLKQQSKN